MGGLKQKQPVLFHAEIEKDVVYTPNWLARGIVEHFEPKGKCLDPCKGGGAFLQHLPDDADWCEITEGRDFFAWNTPMDWTIGNPPYSCLLAWIRHSFQFSDNVAYLMPLHRVFASASFIDTIRRYGGVKEILIVGTGHQVGFPFGHCLGVVHYQRGYKDGTKWSHLVR